MKLLVTQLVKKSPAFYMEPEGSSPCSQKPATGPYAEPQEFSPRGHILFLSFILKSSSHIRGAVMAQSV
jgi:hypothetical protein